MHPCRVACVVDDGCFEAASRALSEVGVFVKVNLPLTDIVTPER